MPGLSGKTALVTGASRGIGAEIARQLGGHGARVALLARSSDDLSRVASEIGSSAIAVVADLTNTAQLSSAVASVTKAFNGAPDIIVNNAGLFRVASLDSMSVESFAEMIATNLIGPFAVVSHFLSAMRERGSGHIVTIGSAADRTTFPGNGAYSAAKFGIRGMHQVLRAELKGSGVRATLISPSAVDTELWDGYDLGGGEFPARSEMLDSASVARAVLYAVEEAQSVNVDELRLSRS
ncbi:MAG TPA: SDR family oxidoreductase [Gemmatimonadaceae bacterium]